MTAEQDANAVGIGGGEVEVVENGKNAAALRREIAGDFKDQARIGERVAEEACRIVPAIASMKPTRTPMAMRGGWPGERSES